MDQILAKRHDIHPPIISGSGCVAQALNFSQKKQKKLAACRKEEKTEEEAGDSNEETSLILSPSVTANARR